MAITLGPKITNDGLILAFDQRNTKKSFKGEPTTNIIPTPSANGRFTTSNNWLTYNTNQYNSNNFFSIGTVSSVSGNVVTMTAAHPFRTFDVVNPSTSGGGLTQHQDYLIKDIGTTQFSIHAYNANQAGSQGYIMTNGFHKVHESIANDTKVSINATNFPTMWKGDPHLPNSHLVKDLHTSGGPENQSFMRLHLNSLDNISDGMAYGVYCPAAVGDTVNISFYARQSPWTVGIKQCSYQSYHGPSHAGTSFTFTPVAEWQKFSHQWTASNTYSFISYFFPTAPTTAIPYYIDMCDMQVELNTESGDTPFTLGTRSNTQALIDMTGNHTITATALDYQTDGTFDFGANESCFVSGPLSSQKGNITMMAWVTQGSRNGPHQTIMCTANGYRSGMKLMSAYHSNGPSFWVANNAGDGDVLVTVGTSGSIEGSGITHLAATRNTSTGYVKIYVNGTLIKNQDTSITGDVSTSANSAYLGIEYHSSGYGLNATIHSGKAYSRVLSDNEVKDIYEAQRASYGV